MPYASHREPGVAARDEDGPGDAIPDTALMRGIVDRDPGALDTLYGRFRRPAHSLARRICLDGPLSEEVLQEVFLAVWRRPEGFDPSRGTVATWLLTMVHHRSVDAVRRETTRRRHTVAGIDAGDDLPGPVGPGADVAALDAVVAAHVRDALGRLPTEQREALALAYYGGHTQREIADLVDVPLGTVKSRMFAAVRRLRDLLDPHVAEGE